jgi:hypothetical protein
VSLLHRLSQLPADLPLALGDVVRKVPAPPAEPAPVLVREGGAGHVVYSHPAEGGRMRCYPGSALDFSQDAHGAGPNDAMMDRDAPKHHGARILTPSALTEELEWMTRAYHKKVFDDIDRLLEEATGMPPQEAFETRAAELLDREFNTGRREYPGWGLELRAGDPWPLNWPRFIYDSRVTLMRYMCGRRSGLVETIRDKSECDGEEVSEWGAFPDAPPPLGSRA